MKIALALAPFLIVGSFASATTLPSISEVTGSGNTKDVSLLNAQFKAAMGCTAMGFTFDKTSTVVVSTSSEKDRKYKRMTRYTTTISGECAPYLSVRDQILKPIVEATEVE